MSEEKVRYGVPRRSTGDVAHTGAKSLLASLPVVGGAAGELFALVVSPPLERRRADWMESVAEGLRRLEARGLDLAALAENEAFVSTVLQATRIALQTHATEKRDALRNACLNTAVGPPLDETVQAIFLDCVERFGTWHLRLLRFAQRPPASPAILAGGFGTVVEQHLSELRGRRVVYDQVWADLWSRGLVAVQSLHVLTTAEGLTQKKTSDLGDQFLAFLLEPAESS